MAIELVTKYLPYVDELFAAESKKSLLTNNDFDWTSAHTIKVYKIGTSAMNDYDRAGTGSGATGSRYGAIENLAASTQSMMICLLYTSPSPRDRQKSRMPSSA